jgi:beta-glucosidase
VLDGVKAKVSKETKVTYVKGCRVWKTDINELRAVAMAAKEAEAAIVVLGESGWRNEDERGTDGEGYDSATLELTGLQQDLVETVVATGTPTIVVLINGRPLAIRWISENVPAIVEAWIPGEKGGQAIAEVLFGDYNPSGRLPITIPRHVGQLPVHYNYKPSKVYWMEKGYAKGYMDMPPTPLFEFGYGLSYTKFQYSNLRISPERTGPGGTIKVNVTISNTGKRAGSEVVQLYINDVVSTVTTPVRVLRGFSKVFLEPGQSKEVEFELGPQELCLLNRDMHWVVEPGQFEVMVGKSCEDIKLRASFTIM